MTAFRDVLRTALESLGALGQDDDRDARCAIAAPLRHLLMAQPSPADMSIGGRALAKRAADLLEAEAAVDRYAVRRLLHGAMPPETTGATGTTSATGTTGATGTTSATGTTGTSRSQSAKSPVPRSVERASVSAKGKSKSAERRAAHASLAEAMGERPAVNDVPRVDASGSSTRGDDATAHVAPAVPRFVIAEGERETVREFVVEASDYVGSAEAALLTLEDRPDDAEAIAQVFRAFHTIKGVASFMTLGPVALLAHEAETLLGKIRDGEVRCLGAAAELAFDSLDLMRAMLELLGNAEEGEELALPSAFAEVIARLGRPCATSASAASSRARREPLVLVAPAANEAPSAPEAATPSAPCAQEPTVEAGADAREPRARSSDSESRGKRSDTEATIRVRTDRLDRLIDMVGELVIAQAMLSEDQLVRSGGSILLQNKVAQATKIVRELHDSTLSLRMVPLRATFQKVARVARDVSHRVGKPVQVVIEGDDTEIDRNTVELLADPLIHMVRNAIDHGVEPTEVREAAGKGVARLAVRAYRAGSDVVIEVEDDGKGIDAALVLRKAVAKGLVGPDVTPTESQTLQLIFEPGFSTRDQVSEISGRGVGMDVVKRAVEALKGAISIHSAVGQGTRFTIRLPLTLAMTDGLLVRVGAHRYVIPLASISESIRPSREAVCTVAERGEFVTVRGELVPIVRIAGLFGLAGRSLEDGLLVILSSGAHRFAVLVDELLGQQQVVAKSLGALGAAPTVAGGAILGDGRVGLILDPAGLLASARLGTVSREPSRALAA
ncbi:MAG: chemotaxis protein CheA [Sandaracinaceae bacterium]|nr:chemotaxis protein CheA [Sandaracinaceae bacterium]